MCGLAGILLEPVERSQEQLQNIRRLFTETLLANEQRGREASGIAIVGQGGDLHMVKQPIPASELVETSSFKAILGEISNETTCLLGHTRAPTKGSPWDFRNNHPLLLGDTVGIHNGHIENDDELFATLALPRTGRVDSEIIFRLLDLVPRGTDCEEYLRDVTSLGPLFEGKFASLSVDLRHPTRLLAQKNHCPLCLHYDKPLGALFFSSRYLFLRKAFGRPVVTEALPNEHAFVFDTTSLKTQGAVPLHSMTIPPPHTDPEAKEQFIRVALAWKHAWESGKSSNQRPGSGGIVGGGSLEHGFFKMECEHRRADVWKAKR